MGARLRLEPSILLPEAWRPRPRRQYFTLPSGESMLWYNHHLTFLYQDPIGLPFEAALHGGSDCAEVYRALTGPGPEFLSVLSTLPPAIRVGWFHATGSMLVRCLSQHGLQTQYHLQTNQLACSIIGPLEGGEADLFHLDCREHNPLPEATALDALRFEFFAHRLTPRATNGCCPLCGDPFDPTGPHASAHLREDSHVAGVRRLYYTLIPSCLARFSPVDHDTENTRPEG